MLLLVQLLWSVDDLLASLLTSLLLCPGFLFWVVVGDRVLNSSSLVTHAATVATDSSSSLCSVWPPEEVEWVTWSALILSCP